MTPTPPEYGAGPVNFANPNDAGPFAAFDNSINYQNMMRYQMVTQYNQQAVTPYNLNPLMQRQVLTDPRYSYGVPEGQQTAYYNRQAELNRTAYTGALTTGALGMAGFGVGGAMMGAVNAAGITAFAGATLLSAPIVIMVAKRVEENMQRQKYMHSIALDLQLNRDKLGMRGLTYDDASSLGSGMADDMVAKKGFGKQAGFFSGDQLMRINKIGIAGGMLNAAGPQAGSIAQYQKNFKELVKTTEEVVKTLRTTIEGGMSVIKEMNQIGFTNLPQIRAQVKSAQGIGSATGMGFQNVMQVGAAGAQAVQGTPWKASVGASMYQMGGLHAYAMSGASKNAAYAVDRAGGVAQAGAIIANSQMNVLQSGIGTRVAAAIMNPNGSLNEDRLRSMLSGKMTGYQTVSQAETTGFAMGSARPRFSLFKEDLLNRLSDSERAGLVNQSFRMWGKERYGSLESKAWVFAGKYTNDSNARRVMYESLLSMPGTHLAATENIVSGMLAGGGFRAKSPQTALVKAAISTAREIVDYSNSFTDSVQGGITGSIKGLGKATDAIGDYSVAAANVATRVLNLSDRYGVFRRGNLGNARDAAMLSYGITQRGDINQDVKSMAAVGAPEPTRKLDYSAGAYTPKKIFSKFTSEQIQQAATDLNTSLQNNTTNKLWMSPNIGRTFGLGNLWGNKNTENIAYTQLFELNKYTTSVKKNYESVSGQYNDWFEKKKESERIGINADMQTAKAELRANGGAYENTIDKTGKVRDTNVALNAIQQSYLRSWQEYDKVKNVAVPKPSSINYLNAEKISATAMRASISEYGNVKGLSASAAAQRFVGYGAGLALGGAIASPATAGVSAIAGGILGGGMILASNQLGKFVAWADQGAHLKQYSKKQFGIDVSSSGGAFNFAEQVAGSEAAMSAENFPTDSKKAEYLKNIYAFSKTAQGKAVKERMAVLGSQRAQLTFEGMSNAAMAQGIELSATAFKELAFDPVASSKKYMGELKKYGATSEQINFWAEKQAKGKEGGLFSQISSKRYQQPDRTFLQRSSDIASAFNRLDIVSKKILPWDKAIKEDVVIDGVNLKGKSISESKEILSRARDKLTTDAIIAGQSGGGGNSASVASPILNYWNNRWAL